MRTFLLLLLANLWTLSAMAQTFDSLTAVLAAATRLDDEAIGDGGEKSATYETFEQWRGMATQPQLVAATGHSSPIVRAYAVRALVHLEAKIDWKALMLQHVMDTAEVTTFEGCCLSKQRVGDVIFHLLAQRLTAEQQLDVAEALLQPKSPLATRDWALRTLQLRPGVLPLVRDLTRQGDDAAAIALARYGLAVDVPLLIERLQAAAPFDDSAKFVAAAIHKDPRLLAPLIALEVKARECLVDVGPSRLQAWLAAIAAQCSDGAGQFLLRFLQASKPTASERELLEAYKRALIPQPECAAFAGVRAELKRRIQTVRGY